MFARCLGSRRAFLGTLSAAAAAAWQGPLAAAEAEVALKQSDQAIEAVVGGKPFFSYRYQTKDPEVPRPYFHPLVGPSGKVITQMGEVPGKRVAHFHHTALWIAHQNWSVEGEEVCDNWQIGKTRSRIEHVQFDAVASGAAGRFVERLDWRNVKGDKTLLEEVRTVAVPRRPADSRVIDLEVLLTARDRAVTFRRTPYHFLAVRVLDAMLPRNGGAIVNSEGKKNPPDGTPARWIDVSGKLDGEVQGVALFDHPGNFRHPTPCLQFAGQTIGLSPTHREPFTLEAGKSLRLRWRVLVHAGDAEIVPAEYEAYLKAARG
jgi:hypothetical protein